MLFEEQDCIIRHSLSAIVQDCTDLSIAASPVARFTRFRAYLALEILLFHPLISIPLDDACLALSYTV